MNAMMKDAGAVAYVIFMGILGLSTQINEILLGLSLLLGVVLLIMRIYSRYLYIKKQKKESNETKKRSKINRT